MPFFSLSGLGRITHLLPLCFLILREAQSGGGMGDNSVRISKVIGQVNLPMSRFVMNPRRCRLP